MSTSPTHPSSAADLLRPRLAVAAALTLAAGVVHAAAAVPHFSDDTVLGAAFTVTGWVQVLVGALLLRRHASRAVVWAGVVTHVAALAALGTARTLGLPVGHGGVEPVALPDVSTALLEVLSLVALAAWLRRPDRTWSSGRLVFGTVLSAAVIALGGSTVAVASLGVSGHGHGGEDPAAGRGGPEAAAPHHDEPAPASLHDDPAALPEDDAHGADAASGDRVHVHADESIHLHVHERPHEHTDGTMHLHAASTSDAPPSPASTPGESHTHAPGEDHD